MKFFIKKLITLIITLLVISFLTFTAFSVIPGDAALSRLGKDATEEQLERANPECPVCREMGRYADELPDADSDGGAVILSRHDPDLRVWTDSSYVPAG